MSEDATYMARAVQLAKQGEGFVEPNPMVGCVIVRGGTTIAEGWHQCFGGPHAEVEALTAAGSSALGATMYVTLEPCCHHGKTPPCTDAILAAGIKRVVVAQQDPFAEVSGQGVELLRAKGISVDTGVGEAAARKLNAPYRSLIERGRPWVIAKWAMTLDGKIASRTGHSQWISSEQSRECVHKLRGRVDAVMVGRRTVEIDDPQLTARPAGPRTAVRIVVDSRASIPLNSKLVQTCSQIPLLVACGQEADPARCDELRAVGSEVLVCNGTSPAERLKSLFEELGRRRMTNVLVEGGSQLLGSLFDAELIDECHTFIAPKIVGGEPALSPIAGLGQEHIPRADSLDDLQIQIVQGDVYVTGRVRR
jgi:diaminohydroxyphosphoribosylaminopyrimidine deaminase/5-amino-6-(5-phosphoribosylamino)uracil reductase